MPGQEERVRNHRWNHSAPNDRTHDVGVLGLRDDLVIEAKERGDGAERQAGRHHQGVVGSGGAFVLVRPTAGKTATAFVSDFAKNRISSVAGAAISAGTETNDPARMK